MEQNWIVDIIFNNETENKQFCLSSSDGRRKLSMNAVDGQNSPEALLYIDEDELVIERVGTANVTVKRGVRERTLTPAHPMRILPNDRIRLGSCEYLIENISRQMPRKPSPFSQFANKAILAGAAAIMMASVPACSPKDAPLNANEQAAEQNQEIKQDAANDAANADNDVKQNIANDAANADNDVKQDDTAECKNIKVMCLNNNRYERCENQPWKLVESCKAPSLCNVNDDKTSTFCENAEPCKDGTYACFGGSLECEKSPGVGCGRDDQMYQCIKQKWVLKTQCASDETCLIQSDNKAVCIEYPQVVGKMVQYNECKYNEVKCDSNAIMNCRIGKWHYKKVCPEGEACQVNDNGRASCVSEK